jgi:SAM-dependent methyltransferase
MNAGFEYSGTELELFAQARNWKAYWSASLARHVAGDVLEVGAGIGTNTELLLPRASGRWTCLEPDPRLLASARAAHERAGLGGRVEYAQGTLETLAAGEYDTLLYLDVLEHVEDDRAELARAAERLRPGGRVVVLAPAHQRLFTEFDRAIGHHRRYDRRSLAAVGPSGLALERLDYLDSVGLCASLANRLFLHQSAPTAVQIRTWDRLMVPLSRVLDPVLLRRVGKSVVAVWRR